MEIVNVGLNHRAAPVEVRELLAFSPTNLAAGQATLLERTVESVILSTCNRMEIYAVTTAGTSGVETIKAFLSDFHGLACADFSPFLYSHHAMDAVDHLFSVASGLDSMILGEPQILGQVRDAYEGALSCQAVGPVLSRAFNQALKVGKKVRSDTGISRHAVSISYAAVELAREIFGGLANRKVLIIGAGKMGELAARTLLDNGIAELLVTNRTFATAVELAARFGGRAADFALLPELLGQADVVITSTGAPGFVVSPAMVRQAMQGRRNRPLFLIDIAVPRDVDPQVQQLDNVFLYDIDDLHAVCAANMEARRKEVILARKIIDDEIAQFAAWWECRGVVPTITALRERVEEIRQAEVERAVGRFGGMSDGQRSTLDAMSCAIVNKILHQPIMRLKAKSNGYEGAEYARVLRELFALDKEV